MKPSQLLATSFTFLLLVIGYWLLVIGYPLPVAALTERCSNPSFGDLDSCIKEIETEINALTPAHEKNKQDLASLKSQVASLQTRIKSLDLTLNQLEKDILDREVDLAYQQQLLGARVRSYYIRSRQYSPLVILLSNTTATRTIRELSYRELAAANDRQLIQNLSQDILKLKQDKQTAQKSRASLATVQTQLNSKANFLQGEVAKVESYLTQLSAKQQELIAAKAGGFQTSIGDTPPTLEPCSGPPGSENFCNPGFAPAFAAFSFGAPHRTGMSQYGAYGRAKSGHQDAESILSAYFQGASLQKDYPIPGSITVSGYGPVPFEDNYLLGIYEVPEKWGEEGGYEALKAQAVAARTYALAVTGNGTSSICATEACQVYKSQLKTGKWAQAVRETRGWVLLKDGQPAKTYYASTAGGFTLSQWGWSGIIDTPGNSRDNWPDQAYEKVAGSPWFYKAWYKSRAGASCGRSHPWLKEEELADILNARFVLDGKGGDSSRISPPDSCWGGNPYSLSELKNIGGYTSVSAVSVVYDDDGSTKQVSFSTNKGPLALSGTDFKQAFNLRAPGYIGLKSTLFNIVKI